MYQTLLLAVDINDLGGANRCTQAAVSMARNEGAVLHILNVVPDEGMAIVSASLGKDHTAKVIESSTAELTSWAKGTIPEDVETKLHVTRGTVYDQIIKTANQCSADGIFVGAHSPTLKDYLIGPNAARVARHATQSVFVIR